MPSALVTGSGIRLGAAIAKALARAGFDIVLHARSSSDAALAVADDITRCGRRAWLANADLGAPDGPSKVAAFVEANLTSLDVLVHNAAAYEHVAFVDVTPEAFDKMMAVNVRAPFFLTQKLLPMLQAASAPCIVNITDMAVSHAYTTTHAFSHYLASKAALEQLTRAWALELGPKIRVNAVAPGPVAIGVETTGEQREEMLRRIPLGREGAPDDIARAVVFLAQATFVTGQTLRIDGGLSVA